MASEEGKKENNNEPESEKKFKEVSMAKLSTHNTEVSDASSFTVMSSTGDVILFGKGPGGFFQNLCGNPKSFYVYNKSGGKWRRVSKFKALCKHPRVHMLPIKIRDEGELLAVSCVGCRVIRLYNLEMEDVTVAFRSKEYRLGRMCHGKPGQIFVLVATEKHHLHALELDYTKDWREFRIRRVGTTDRPYRNYNGMVVHVPLDKNNSLVVSSNKPKKTVRTISFQEGVSGWEYWYGGWERQIDGSEFFPSGMVYSPRHGGVLLIADKINSRLVVLNPEDGTHVQTAALDLMGCVQQMCLYKDEIVLWHNDPYGSNKKERVSYFSTPIFSWDKIKP